MIAASFPVTLQLRGPVMTQSTTKGRFGVDAVMAQSGGRYYLPGSLLKGLIGEAWQELSCVDREFGRLREKWLGLESKRRTDGGGDEPLRGPLFFSDLVDEETETDGVRTQYRIEIDGERGSVRQGAYLVLEAPYRPGQRAVFAGVLRVLAATRAEAEEVRSRVQTALRWMTAAGSEKSAGFGRVLDGECGALEVRQWTAKADDAADSYTLALRFDRPVCFARRRVADNLFESERHVTGAALKGSVAFLIEKLGKWPNLKRHLWAVRFSHAFPTAPGTERPAVPPQSLVYLGKSHGPHRFRDVLEQRACARAESMPEFAVDWKDEVRSAAWRHFRWPALKTELRVRTAMDGETRRAAEAKLFAYEMIVPEDRRWLARVDLGGVEASARAAVAAELQEALSNGLFALGKTKAWAATELKAADLERPSADGMVALTLQSDALLVDPSRHLASNGELGNTSEQAMKDEYRDVWRDLSGGALTLENYFHRLSLAGGGYFRHRFQKDQSYRPFLLTEAGSAFLLSVVPGKEEAATAKLRQWQRSGLEVSDRVAKFYGLRADRKAYWWQQCPFVPENGYGEIACNLFVPGIVEVADV